MKKIILGIAIIISFSSNLFAYGYGNTQQDLETAHRLYLYGIDEYQMGHILKARDYFKNSCENYFYLPACRAMKQYGLK